MTTTRTMRRTREVAGTRTGRGLIDPGCRGLEIALGHGRDHGHDHGLARVRGQRRVLALGHVWAIWTIGDCDCCSCGVDWGETRMPDHRCRVEISYFVAVRRPQRQRICSRRGCLYKREPGCVVAEAVS